MSVHDLMSVTKTVCRIFVKFVIAVFQKVLSSKHEFNQICRRDKPYVSWKRKLISILSLHTS